MGMVEAISPFRSEYSMSGVYLVYEGLRARCRRAMMRGFHYAPLWEKQHNTADNGRKDP